MGIAKKLLQDKDIKEKATVYANSVTFDLIGINRSSRKGQESCENALLRHHQTSEAIPSRSAYAVVLSTLESRTLSTVATETF